MLRMDALTHCKAMEAFCRQRSKMESEAAGFWLDEAQSWRDRQAALAGKTKPKLKPTLAASRKMRNKIAAGSRAGA
jgi:hypothetical protein